MTKKHNHTFKFHDINEYSINSIIVKLLPKTNFGFDGLSTWLIIVIKPILVRPITIIINQMLNTSVFPDKLKIAKINPIFKKDDNTLLTNYRLYHNYQLSLKYLRKLYFSKYIIISKKKKHFYNAQYGFCTKHTTEFAALELVDRIILNMDKKDTPAGIFLDLSKSFDTLDYDILLFKLKFYGFCISALNLMENYLTGRQQFV